MRKSHFFPPLIAAVFSQQSLAWTSPPALATSRTELRTKVKRDGSLFSSGTAQSSSTEASVVRGEDASSKYMNFGILISSFTDGIVNNDKPAGISDTNDEAMTAARYFQYCLLSLLTQDKVRLSQDEIEESVKFSPCQGPNIDSLENLEKGDDIMDMNSSREEKITHMLHYLRDDHGSGKTMEIKVVYIPTAMYALRADSQNTPGKQRQRARADGKKRRNQLVHFIKDMFSNDHVSPDGINVNISAVTLDLDDGSIKQPYSGSDDEGSMFPNNGKEALTSWNPHIIYVEGGNTFWLHYCMNKGSEDWSRLISEACCCTDSDDRRPALYVGKSAGAIVAGKHVKTATWKGWDDPSIVPGLETYDDWMGTRGLDFAGGASIFPHMSKDWVELVKDKKGSLDGDKLVTLQEWEACCIEGSLHDSFISS